MDGCGAFKLSLQGKLRLDECGALELSLKASKALMGYVWGMSSFTKMGALINWLGGTEAINAMNAVIG